MVTVDVDDLTTGLVLAKDVMTPSGHLVFPRGTTIDKKTIQALQSRGFRTIEVESASTDTEKNNSDDIMLQLNRLFRHTDTDHPFIKQLVSARKEKMTRQDKRR